MQKKVQILCKTQVSTTTVFRPFIKLCFFSLCRLLCSKDFISMTTIHFWSSVGLHRRLWRLMWQTLSFKSVLTYYCNHLIGWCFWCLQRSIRCSLSPIKHSTFLSVFKSQMAKQMSDCFCPFLLKFLAQIQTDSWATEIIFSHGSHCDPGWMFLSLQMCQHFLSVEDHIYWLEIK